MDTRDTTTTHEAERYATDENGEIIYVPVLTARQRRAIVEEFRRTCAREFFVDAALACGEDASCRSDGSWIKLPEMYSGLGLDSFGVHAWGRQQGLSPKQAFFGGADCSTCPQCGQSCGQSYEERGVLAVSTEHGQCSNCGVGAWMNIPVFAPERRAPVGISSSSADVSPKTRFPDLARGHPAARTIGTYALPP